MASPHQYDVSSISVSTVVNSTVMQQLDTGTIAVDFAPSDMFQGDSNIIDD